MSILHDYEAIQLFVQRAQDVRRDFHLTPQNARLVAQICHRLDGIPFAIELAAARIRTLSVDAIVVRLDDRFHLLTGGSRTAPQHQQTMLATIDWSYDLTSDAEKALLQRLSVFAGGWTLEAAESVCATANKDGSLLSVLDLLTSLVDQSLVVSEEREGKVRYRLLETIREYGQHKLHKPSESGENEAVRARHRDYFLALAEEAEPNLKGAEQVEWLHRLEEEHENLRATLEWSLLEVEGSLASLRLCGALQRFWATRGHFSEGRKWCLLALDATRSSKQSLERAETLNAAGQLASLQGDYDSSPDYFAESLTIGMEIGDRSSIATSLNGLGRVAYSQGDYARAQPFFAESLTIYKEMGDRRNAATTLNNLGNMALLQGDYVAAMKSYEESLDVNRKIGDINSVAAILCNLGHAANSQGDYARAQACFEEGLAIHKQTGNRIGIAISRNGLGSAIFLQGDYALARFCFAESLTISEEIGDRSGIAFSLNLLGNVALMQGDYTSGRANFEKSLTIRTEIGERSNIAISLEAFADLAAKERDAEQAAVLWGAAEKLREQIDTPQSPNERKEYDCAVAEMRQTLGEEAFSAAWTQGRSMLLERAIAYALENGRKD